MENTVETFPQDRVKPSDLTLVEFMVTEIDTSMGLDAMLAALADRFPNVTGGEAAEAWEEAMGIREAIGERAAAEAEAMELGLEIVQPFTDENPGMAMGELLKIASERGDRRADAMLSLLNSAARKEDYRVLDLAVADDPYWGKTDRGYNIKEGATFTTPEELTAAYRRTHGMEAGD